MEPLGDVAQLQGLCTLKVNGFSPFPVLSASCVAEKQALSFRLLLPAAVSSSP